MADIILDDLEIDHSTMLSNPEAFVKQVYAKAEELKELLKADDSVQNYVKAQPKPTQAELAPFKSALDQIYTDSDAVSVGFIQSVIDLHKQAIKDLENQLWYRANTELAKSQGKLSKQTIHQQYIQLREVFNKYIDALEIFKKNDGYSKLPSMPGNYGSPVGFIHYIFEFENGDTMMNPSAVSKKIGQEFTSLMDTVEFIDSHSDCGVVVKRVRN